MPISVGEVNATLRFTILSADIGDAQSRLRTLAEQFREAGGDATVMGQRYLAQMVELQKNLDQMRVSAAQTKIEINKLEEASGFRKIKEEADQAGQSMDQLQGLAMRMVERMLILYALRETFAFVKGLYDSADALTLLNERTGLSITYLQQLEQVGETVGVKFTGTEQAINHLDKTLDEFKGGDALHELGLSFEQIFSMSPDERFNTIAGNISKIASPSERAKIEIQLFGTDGVDPLVVKLGQLGKAIKDVTDPLDEKTVRTLAGAKRAYDEFGDGLKHAGAEIIDFGSKVVNAMIAPEMVLMMSGFQGLRDAANNGLLFGRSLSEVGGAAQDAAKSIHNLPVEGQAFIDSLKQEIPLTKEQKTALDELRAMGELSYQNAVRATAHNQITTAQYKAYEAAVKAATKAESEHEAELRKDATTYQHYETVIDEVLSAGTSWKTTLAQIETQYKSHSATIVEMINGQVTFASVTTDATSKVVAEAKELLNAGVSQKVVAEWTGLTATQVKALVAALKDEDTQRKLANKTAEDTIKILAKLAEITADEEASSLQKHINANNRKYEDDVANAKKRGVVDIAYYDALEALRVKSNALAEKHLSDETAFSRVHYQQMYLDAKAKYDAMLQNSGDHTDAELKNMKREVDGKKKMFDDWRNTAVQDLAQAGTAADGFVTDFDNGLKFVGQNLDDTKIKVRLLSGEIVTLKEAIDRFNAGNSMTYDLSTVAGVENYRKLNTGATISLSDAQIIAMATAGWTLERLIAAGYIDPYGKYNSATANRGALPHAASGGLVTEVGEEGPELVRLPVGAAVFPTNSVPAGMDTGRGSLTQHFYINGTAGQVYTEFKKLMMRDLRSSRMLGAA